MWNFIKFEKHNSNNESKREQELTPEQRLQNEIGKCRNNINNSRWKQREFHEGELRRLEDELRMRYNQHSWREQSHWRDYNSQSYQPRTREIILPNDPNEPQWWYLRWIWEVDKVKTISIGFKNWWIKAKTKTNIRESPVDMSNFEFSSNWYNSFRLSDYENDRTYIISKIWERISVVDGYWRNIDFDLEKVPVNRSQNWNETIIYYEQRCPYILKFNNLELEMKFDY